MFRFHLPRSATWLMSMAWLGAACMLVTACGGSGEPGAGARRGQRLYIANCALCHGQSGEGKVMLGKSLQGSEFVRGLSDEGMVEFLREGRRADHPLNESGVDMPPRGGNPGLTDEDLQSIVDYLRTLG